MNQAPPAVNPVVGAAYAQAPEMVNLGPASVEKADFDAVKASISDGPMVRLAQN